MNDKKRSGLAFWLLVWGLGLAGQICWNMDTDVAALHFADL